jgi:CRP-like cAMP-binding protein
VYNFLVPASVEILKKVPLFEGLDKRDLQEIAGSMRERRFAEGDLLTEEGAGAAGFFIVAEGKADITVGGEPRGSIGPGDYFGEVALLTGSDRTATLVAVTDMVCYGMTPWDFRPLVEGNTTIAWKLLKTMADRQR